MYYLELIERFWIFNQNAKPGSAVIALYLYLLKTAKNGEAYSFKVSDVVLSKELGMTRQTVKATKEKLRDLGLIEFQTKNGVSGTYRLLLNYSLEKSRSVNVKDPERAVTSFQNMNGSNNLVISDMRKESQSANEDDEIKTLSSQLSNENAEIPQLSEFLAYAKTLSAYQPELDSAIEDKYKGWKDKGWKNSSDRLITNWRSSLKSTLPFLKGVGHFDQLSLQTIPDIKRPISILGNDQQADV
ncbi:hypothetical protein LPB85_12800 [Chryseobacterium sp. LC2016-27]|uniref:hypothetical protein n=1 Tax=Chryseobacterium sp. LC2016-27 TaxID=2897326 RepID=UPI001E458917|nr:hypothetical protein [Chryseobacterium sp. LC2016-27]MCD0456316.1 hypothetical protein [Chryseobacterium sp. LC2016-27]